MSAALAPDQNLRFVIPVENAGYNDQLYGKCRVSAVFRFSGADQLLQDLRPVFFRTVRAQVRSPRQDFQAVRFRPADADGKKLCRPLFRVYAGQIFKGKPVF